MSRRLAPARWLAFACFVAAVLACASLPAPFDRLGAGPTPIVLCTPPPCPPGGSYVCGAPSGDCPGGCGTICLRPTPDPNASPTASAANSPRRFLCPIVVRTPPPEAPTASLNGTAVPDDFVDPHVEVCASAVEVPVGGLVTVEALAVDIGLPHFQVSVRPAGAADFVPLLEVTYDNQVRSLATGPVGAAFVYSQAQGTATALTLELLAVAPGALDLVVSATGEIHYGYPGPATWGGGGSEILLLTAVGP